MFQLLFFVLMLYLLPGGWWAFRHGLEVLFASDALRQPLLLGFGSGTLLWFLALRWVPGLATLEHELTHALVAKLLGMDVVQIRVTRHEGGMVLVRGRELGRLRLSLMGLAPYYLPTVTLILALVAALVGRQHAPGVLVGVGATLAYHTFSTVEESWSQWKLAILGRLGGLSVTDIGESGLVYSGIVTAALTLILHSLLWILIASGYGAVPRWCATMWNASRRSYAGLARAIAHLVS